MCATLSDSSLHIAERLKPRVAGRIVTAVLLLGAPIAAQSPTAPPIPISPGIGHVRLAMTDPSMFFSDTKIEARQAKMLNVQRQQAIVTDTEKILQLARELEADAHSARPTMSLAERMHKAEEIEKLAKTVREKMTYAIGAPPPPNPYAAWQVPR
jgi:HAMP domain-containing protein